MMSELLNVPDVLDLLDGMPLKDAFWRFVLRDPEVQRLGRKAVEVSPDLRRVYEEGWCYPSGGREWPVAFTQGDLAGGRSENSPVGYLEGPPPLIVQQAADAVGLRYTLLLTILRDGKLTATGDPVRSRGGEQILSSIWSHRSYYFDAQNGDVLQIKNDEITDWNGFLVKRWLAVTLKHPRHTRPLHVKPLVSDGLPSATATHDPVRSDRKFTIGEASIDQAIKALWPDGIPRGLPVKERDHLIQKWQCENNIKMTDAKSIYRFLKRTN